MGNAESPNGRQKPNSLTMETKFYLTANGNILVVGGENLFMNSNHDFLRLVGSQEVEFLTSKLEEITFKGEPKLPGVALWKHLWSTEYHDGSDYVFSRSGNGGNYGFTSTYHYFTRTRGKVIEFCRLEYARTTSDFTYTDDGDFTEDFASHKIIDIEGEKEWFYDTQKLGRKNREITLDRLAETVNAKDALYAGGTTISSNYDEHGSYEGESKEIKVLPDMAEKIHRLKILREMTGLPVKELLGGA